LIEKDKLFTYSAYYFLSFATSYCISPQTHIVSALSLKKRKKKYFLFTEKKLIS